MSRSTNIASRIVRRNLPSWQIESVWLMAVVQGGRGLALLIRMNAPEEFVVAAIETTAGPNMISASSVQATGAVFEDHAHHVVGEYDSLEKAQDAGDAYARDWLKGKIKSTKCGCKDLW